MINLVISRRQTGAQNFYLNNFGRRGKNRVFLKKYDSMILIFINIHSKKIILIIINKKHNVFIIINYNNIFYLLDN